MIRKVTITKFGNYMPESFNHTIIRIMSSTQFETEELIVIKCYCCDDFTEHEVYETEEGTYYQCDCGCTLNDQEDEIIFPEESNYKLMLKRNEERILC